MTLDATDRAAPAPPVTSLHTTLPEQASTGVMSRRYRALTLGMVSLVALGAFEALAVATAMPAVAQALDGLHLYALAFGGTLAASVVGMVLAGQWGDARGPAAPLWNGLAWFVAGLLVAGLAQRMPVLLLGRILQGFGAGGMSVALYMVVARVYPENLRPRMFAAFSAGWVVPSLIGPTLSGLIVTHAGWRWVFLAVPLLALPAGLMLRPGLRRLPQAAPSQASSRLLTARLGWALGAAIGACLLYLGGQRHDASGAALLLLGLAMLGLCALRLLPTGTLRAARGLPSVIALRGLASAAFFGAEVFLPLMLMREYGWGPVAAGVALSLAALAWFGGSWFQGNRGHRLSRTSLLRAGTALMSGGIALVMTVLAFNLSPLVAIAGWVLTGLGMGLVYPTLSLHTLGMSSQAQQGANTSALQLCDSLSIATALAVGGSLFAALLASAPQAAFLACFALPAALAILALVLSGRVRPSGG